MIKKYKKHLAILFAAVLLITSLVPQTLFSAFAADKAAAPKSLVSSYDFFTDKYPKLTDKNHVFQTAEFAQIYHYFLGGIHNGAQSFWATYNAETAKWSNSRSYEVNVKSGNHIFLLGGTWTPELQASIGYINEVAKEYSIGAIYNFDNHLDGKAESSIDIFEDPGVAADYNTTAEYNSKVYYRQRGDALAKSLLGNGEQSDPHDASDLSTPSILIWNKDNAGSPLVTSFSWDDTTADFGNAATVEAFKAGLRAQFDKISTTVGGKKVASSVNVSQSEYYRENENARFKAAYGTNTRKLLNVDGTPITVNGVPQYGSDLKLFTESDTKIPFEVVTYEELRGVLDSEGNHAILFTGLWCPNGFANLRNIYDYALKYNLDKIYFFDPELDSTTNNSITSIRNSERTYISGLYIDLFTNVFNNIGPDGIKTRFDNDYDNFIASEELRRAAANQPALTEAEKKAYRYYNGGSRNGYSIYEKIPGETGNPAPVSENARWASRIQYPALVFYNKDHKDANGKSATVISLFEQLWYSGANLAAPGTFGYYSSTQGRVFEYQEYINNNGNPDTVHGLGNYNIDTNASTPKTNIAANKDENGYDKRGVNTPVISRAYWSGLNETFDTFVATALKELATDAETLDETDYTPETYAALKLAVGTGKSTAAFVANAQEEARAADLAKVNASLTGVRLTAAQQVGSFESNSEVLNTAYAELAAAYNGLKALAPASPTDNVDKVEDDSPDTGDVNFPLFALGLALVSLSLVVVTGNPTRIFGKSNAGR